MSEAGTTLLIGCGVSATLILIGVAISLLNKYKERKFKLREHAKGRELEIQKLEVLLSAIKKDRDLLKDRALRMQERALNLRDAFVRFYAERNFMYDSLANSTEVRENWERLSVAERSRRYM